MSSNGQQNGNGHNGKASAKLSYLGPDQVSGGVAVASGKAPESDRNAKGQFLKGHALAGPGRPSGSIDLMAVARKKADEQGIDLSDIVWGALTGLSMRADQGDAAAAKVLLDRVCGAQEKAQTVNVAVGVNSTTAIDARPGPPMPKSGEFRDYVRKFAEVATNSKQLPDGVYDAAEAQAKALEDMCE